MEALLGSQSISSWSRMIGFTYQHRPQEEDKQGTLSPGHTDIGGWVWTGCDHASPKDAGVGSASIPTLVSKFPLPSHSSSLGATVCKRSHFHWMSWQYRERAFPKAQPPCLQPRVCLRQAQWKLHISGHHTPGEQPMENRSLPWTAVDPAKDQELTVILTTVVLLYWKYNQRVLG